MNIEVLKEQARRHEQKEEWKKALEVYKRAIEKLAGEDQPDVSLYNRVGDLCVRIGELDEATKHYEMAVDVYLEAELPNNAIAVCKKIIRNVPARNPVYLKMGRIRAEQGFLTDARQNFLIYAERMQAAGNLGEALRALEELADLSPGDIEIRLSLAQQLQQHGRASDAIEQLRAAHGTLVEMGDSARAGTLLEKAREIDSSVDFGAAAPRRPQVAAAATSSGEPPEIQFGEITLAGGSEEEVKEEPKPAEPADAGLSFDSFEIALSSNAEEEKEEAEEEATVPLPTLDEAWPSFSLGEEAEEEGEPLPTLGEAEEEPEPLPVLALGDAEEEEEALPLPTFSLPEPDEEEEQEEEEAEPLPMLGMDQEEPSPLPMIEIEEEAPAPLPLLAAEEPVTLTAAAFGESDRDERHVGEMVTPGREMPEVEITLSGVDLPGSDAEPAWERAQEDAAFQTRAAARSPEDLIAAGDLTGAERLIRDLMEREPTELSHRQRLVEVAFRRGDQRAQAEAYVELARCLERSGSEAQAGGVYQQVLQLDPENAAARTALAGAGRAAAPEVAQMASSEDYVDLGSLIFGDDDEEKTTRFRVAYEEPSGDEDADFARMLSQFKAKIAENVGADDVRAHHDLGTAYKEMGLLDEAIEEFQAALRASREHLPTYELLGQAFLDKGQPEAAVKSLERALTLPVDVEDELLGIYYFLGRAYEQTGNKESAVEFYDRVFSLDINFMDVTERLRALR